MIALLKELLRGLTFKGEAAGPSSSGMARNGACAPKLERNRLFNWARAGSTEIDDVFDGLRRWSMELTMLSREPTLGTDAAVFGGSASSSSESDDRERTLVALGSKSAKLSVVLDARDVRVCLLDTLAE